MIEQGHPIDVDLERILPILAREIYTSPFAFIRENVQNAFDAIRMQQFRDRAAGVSRDHRISITLDGKRLSISDTGIGMSRADLANYFWSIGKSGKHTSEAKSAGVVGTFGIGGMANFGVCSRLEVETRTHDAAESIVSYAERAQLSAKENCVFYAAGSPGLSPGTTVTGTLLQATRESDVVAYLASMVRFLNVPIQVGDRVLRQEPFPKADRDEGASYTVTAGSVEARVWIRGLQNGQAEIEVERCVWKEIATDIVAVFSTGTGIVTAYQHGFMLASVPVTSIFGLGGVINGSALRPTAGREAVTDETRTLVQNLMSAIENGLATHISRTLGLPNRFSSFYRYISQYGLWTLAGSATVRVYGSNARVRLDALRSIPEGTVYFARDGHDQSIMQSYAEQNKTVVLLSSDGYRQTVESNYLTNLCNGSALEDRVTCIRVVDKLTLAEEAFKYQLQDRLRRQFLIDGLHIRAGELSHRAMLWISPTNSSTERVLFIDFSHPQAARLVGLRNSLSFDAVFDIFIRDSVLPHLESAFPDLRKRDFDDLLRKLQSTVEYFQVDPSDVGRIQQLAAVTNMPPESVAAVFGGRRPAITRLTFVATADVFRVAQQVNQFVEEAKGKSQSLEEIRRELQVRLLETELEAKVLDATEIHEQIGLARNYIGLTRDAHVLYRRIFLERNPSTDFSWGGHRAGYLFYSEGSAVVYYDIQFEHVIGASDSHERTGKITMEHPPLLMKNQVFLPIPKHFERYLVPIDRTLKFTIRHQILGVDRGSYNWD